MTWQPIETAPRDGTPVILRKKSSGEECGWPAVWSKSFHFPCWYQEVGGVSDDADWHEWKVFVPSEAQKKFWRAPPSDATP